MSMSNKLSAVIAKLQKLQAEFGDLEVSASTQDGADYNVYDDSIGVETYTDKNGNKKQYVYATENRTNLVTIII